MENLDKVLETFADKLNSAEVFKSSTGNTSSSALGAWVNAALLALILSEQADETVKNEIENLLGCSVEHAEKLLIQLIVEQPAVVSFAIALWYKDGFISSGVLKLAQKLYSISFSIKVNDSLPSTEELNSWVAEKTLGIIKKLPVELKEDDVALLVNAVATKVNWTSPYEKRLEEATNNFWGVSSLLFEEQASFRTEVTKTGQPVFVQWKTGNVMSKSPVGVPLIVYTAIGNEDVSYDELYLKILEVHKNVQNHSPNNKADVEKFLSAEPDFVTTGVEQGYGSPIQGKVTLPAWSANTNISLDSLPLYELVNREWGTQFNETVETRQATVVNYDRLGYEAASVTYSMIRATGMPQKKEQLILDVKYDRPFVSVAFISNTYGSFSNANGAEVWKNVPLFVSVVREAVEVSQ